jgi:hypothetical protein
MYKYIRSSQLNDKSNHSKRRTGFIWRVRQWFKFWHPIAGTIGAVIGAIFSLVKLLLLLLNQ